MRNFKKTLDKRGSQSYYNNITNMERQSKEDPLIAELKKVQADEGWSNRRLAVELGVHYLTVHGWYHGTPPSKMSRRIIKQYLISRL